MEILLILISAFTPLIVGPLVMLLGLNLILIIGSYIYKKIKKEGSVFNLSVKVFKWMLIILVLVLVFDSLVRSFIG